MGGSSDAGGQIGVGVAAGVGVSGRVVALLSCLPRYPPWDTYRLAPAWLAVHAFVPFSFWHRGLLR